jgi:hypothetical protein
MKAWLMSIWVLIGLVVGLGFGGYVVPMKQANAYATPEPDRAKQLWHLLIGAGVGVGCGFGIANAIFEQTKK